MYAVIKAGGKQHRVAVGDVIEVELMRGGDQSVTFSPLMVVDDDGKAHVGKEVAKAAVKAKLAGEQKGDKVKVFKYRPKTGYAKSQGHRQLYTLVEITDISLPKARAASAKKAEDAPAAADEPVAAAESESASESEEAPAAE
jgi:large subunit ribosomal protein L21